MKNEKGFSLLEVVIACMVLMIVASAVIPSAWKFYRQAAVEYEAEHLLSDLRRAQSLSRLATEKAYGYGAKQSANQETSLQIYERKSYLNIGTNTLWYSPVHHYLPFVRIVPKDSESCEKVSFDNSQNDKPGTLLIYCDGYQSEGRRIVISRGRICMERRK